MNDLLIKYPRGTMLIHMEEFFPAAVDRVRKLYQVIRLSEQSEDLMNDIFKYIDDNSSTLEIRISETARSLVDDRTAYKEKKEQYLSKRKANGVPIRKEQMPEWKDAVQTLKEKCRSDESEYARLNRVRTRLQRNKLLLMKLDGRC